MPVRKKAAKKEDSAPVVVTSFFEEEVIATGKVQQKFPFRTILFLFGILVLFLLIIIGVYFFVQNQKTKLSTPAAQTNQVIEEVGKLIDLPSEVPTIATITDISKLKGQLFFTNAKNGDKVLIYANAKKAIIYDPTTNKLVNVGPFGVTQSTQQTTQGSSPTPQKVSVALLNGTQIVGFTRTIEDKLKTADPTANVISKGNAVKSTYTTTIIVDISGNQTTQAQTLAKGLNGTISQMPQGEIAPPNASIVIILGTSSK